MPSRYYNNKRNNKGTVEGTKNEHQHNITPKVKIGFPTFDGKHDLSISAIGCEYGSPFLLV